jgi:hypothetical protein
MPGPYSGDKEDYWEIRRISGQEIKKEEGKMHCMD